MQSKTSPNFSAADIGTFLFGVEQFFSAALNNSSNIEFRAEIEQKIDLVRTIYGQSIRIQDNPKCSIYYVSAGKWTNAPEPTARLLNGRSRLETLNVFSHVRTTPVDADLLKAIYRELERSVVKEIEFIRTTSFPRIDRVDEAYIGLLPGDEFIKLVSADDGSLNRELFFDNVRDFQGHNSVNREIEQTLAEDHLRDSFPLLNNGITIIARSIRRTGDTFQIHNFQIVNGCQTTHIIFQNKHLIGADTFVPVKMVVTDDSQVVNEVIKATNRQTEVLPEALESLSSFHRELEDLYRTRELDQSSADKIFYERRSKQYGMDSIRPSNIVTLTTQITSFIGMFLEEPHAHPRYYGELLKAYQGRIFASNHKPEPYYASGVALLKMERWLNSRTDWRELRPYKHQLLMLMRISISGSSVPRLNSNAISAYSLRIVDLLRQPETALNEFEKAIGLIRSCLEQFRSQNSGRLHDSERNPPHRLRAFTELLKANAGSVTPSQATNEIFEPIIVGNEYRGRIIFFDDVKRYGFINNNVGPDLFVHETEIGEVPYHLRIEGVEVAYKIAPNPMSPGMLMASNVRLVPREELTRR